MNLNELQDEIAEDLDQSAHSDCWLTAIYILLSSSAALRATSPFEMRVTCKVVWIIHRKVPYGQSAMAGLLRRHELLKGVSTFPIMQMHVCHIAHADGRLPVQLSFGNINVALSYPCDTTLQRYK